MEDQQLITIEEIDTLNLDNRELLNASLLQYWCKTNKRDDMFYQICDYLYKKGLISNKSMYDISNAHMRYMCMKFIEKIGQHNNIRIKDSRGSKLNDHKTIKSIDDSGINSRKLVPYKKCEHININSRYSQDFVELEMIGEGSFGSVYKCYHQLDGNIYAIKKIVVEDDDYFNNIRSLSEVQILAKLNHPHIIRYYATWVEFDDIFPQIHLQMELCKLTLRQYLEERNYGIGLICVEQEMKRFKQIVGAIHYLHEQDIIHRDVNPMNIFIDNNDDIKIGDFGLAQYKNNPVFNYEYGHYLYKAPEKNITIAVDIYSCGIILYELLNIFTTNMERMITLKNKDKLSNDNELISKMICSKEERFSALTILNHIS